MNDTTQIYKRNCIHEIVLPQSIITWILTHIREPITGYEHKVNQQGEFMSIQEQLSETQFQLMVIATDYFRRGASIQKIFTVLSQFE